MSSRSAVFTCDRLVPWAHGPAREHSLAGLRPSAVRTPTRLCLLICPSLVAAMSACSGFESKPSVKPSPATALPAPSTDTSRPVRNSVTVSLTHCGFDPIKHNGQTWEVPHPPFDGTTAPDTWNGKGTVILLTVDQLRYRDSSGIEVDFVPDDGKAPSPCA